MKVPNRRLLGIFLLAASLVLLFMELNTNNSNPIAQPYFLTFGLVIFAAYCIKFYTDDYRFILSSFYQVFYYFGMLVSAALISSEAYMYEIGQYGTANGAFWLTIVFAVIGLESAYIGYKSQRKAIYTNFPKKLNKLFIKSLIYGTLVASFLILLTYGSPLNQDVTRVNYWGLVAPSYLSPIRILIFTSFLLAVVNYYQRRQVRGNTVLAKAIIMLYIVVAIFLLGEKFTAAIFFIFAWLIVKSSISSKIEFSNTFLKVFAILLVALTYVAFIYEGKGVGYDFIVTRVSLQGQVLWSALNEDLETIAFGANLIFNQGFFDVRDTVERRYLPTATYVLNQDTGTSLSGFFPAIPILLLGLPLAVVAHAIFSIYLGRVQAQLMQSVRSGDHVAAFLKFTIYFFLIAMWYVGNINTFKIVLVSYIACFVYQDIKQYLAVTKKVHHV